MKDLTHYFNSPKEEHTTSKDEESEIIVGSPIKMNTKEKSPAPKKRKVYLSKRKAKVGLDVNKPLNSNGNEISVQSESAEETNTDRSKQKKRKLKGDNTNSVKKNKPAISPNINKKSNKEANNKKTSCNSSDSTIAVQKSSASNEEKIQIINVETIQIESSNSCEDIVFESRKTKRCRRVLDSDEETSLDKEEENNQSQPKSKTDKFLKKIESQPKKIDQEKFTNTEISPSNTRNSLFGYFNKVDKETALKQKSEKIKVEVLIHLPPSEGNTIRKSIGKPVDIKTKKQKKKVHLDDSDTIEVICSENIVDENSSVTANAPQVPSSVELQDISNGAAATLIPDETTNTSKPKTTCLASIFLPKKTEKSVIHDESENCHTNKETVCTSNKVPKKNKQPSNKLKKIKKMCMEQSDIESSEKTSVTSKQTESSVLKSSNGNTLKKSLKTNSTSNSQTENCKVKTKNSTAVSLKNNKEKQSMVLNDLNKLVTETISKSNGDDLYLDNSDSRNSNEDKLLQKCEVVIENCSKSPNVQAVLRLSSSKKIKNVNTLKSKKVSEEKYVNIPNSENSHLEEITPLKSNLKSKIEKRDKITPKNKPITLNGYFTPKTISSSAKKEDSNDGKKGSKTTPLWVMKVRLSSPDDNSIRPMGSEENSVDFIEKISQLSSVSLEDSMIVKEETENSKTTLNKVSSSDAPVSDETLSTVPDGKSKEDSQFILQRRPKRSCRLKITTEESPKSPASIVDEDSSDNSQRTKSKRRSMMRSVKKPKPIEIEDDDDEDVVEIKTNEKSDIPKPVKIWPFFNKKEVRQEKPDPVDEEKLKAKQKFLESGVPEIIKRKVENNKNEIVTGSPAPFPTVSHVTQSNGAERVDADLILPPTRCTSPLLSAELKSESYLTADDHEDPDIPVFERPGNVKAVLKLLKEEEPKTEVKALYKRLKEYRGGGSSDIWTEVYKPTTAADMVGNSDSIKKLKTWLETLKNRRTKEGSDSSGAEFVDSDSEDESRSNNNMAVLSGPCGCGKTSAVYAVAKELDCKVLEINASCNRSGKRVLAEFSESTQSHQVKRAPTANEFFDNQTKGSSKKKKKWKLSKEAKAEKTSLILVEDADLLFTDVDEGFMSSLSSLAAASKRPIVLITNHNRNPHLERFRSTRLLQLSFSRPKAAKLSLWLRLVALVEGVIMSRTVAAALVSWAGCDVRRCLLQLQLMVHSNNSEIKQKVTEGQLWWLWPDRYQLKFELPSLVQEESEQSADCSDKQLIMKQLDSVAKTTNHLAYLDVLSTYASQVGSSVDEDPCPKGWRPRWRDSTSLTPCQEGPRTGVTEELSEWLARAETREWNNDGERVGQSLHECRWLSVLRQGEQMLLSGVSTGLRTDHCSVACDYLPTLRDVARAERVRLANYTRRADRFFNYLQGLGITASKPCRDFMCDVFS